MAMELTARTPAGARLVATAELVVLLSHGEEPLRLLLLRHRGRVRRFQPAQRHLPEILLLAVPEPLRDLEEIRVLLAPRHRVRSRGSGAVIVMRVVVCGVFGGGRRLLLAPAPGERERR